MLLFFFSLLSTNPVKIPKLTTRPRLCRRARSSFVPPEDANLQKQLSCKWFHFRKSGSVEVNMYLL